MSAAAQRFDPNDVAARLFDLAAAQHELLEEVVEQVSPPLAAQARERAADFDQLLATLLGERASR